MAEMLVNILNYISIITIISILSIIIVFLMIEESFWLMFWTLCHAARGVIAVVIQKKSKPVTGGKLSPGLVWIILVEASCKI
jgi:hypothetical protein